jgi:hypothetical protein
VTKAAIRAEPATSTEAAPPKPLNRPTISGIEVILTRSAVTVPITDPTATPITSRLQS